MFIQQRTFHLENTNMLVFFLCKYVVQYHKQPIDIVIRITTLNTIETSFIQNICRALHGRRKNR